MTNKEAIRELNYMIHSDRMLYGDKPQKPRNEALDFAIKALEDIEELKMWCRLER